MCSACTALGPDPAPSCSCAGFIKEALHFQACSLLPSGVVPAGAFCILFCIVLLFLRTLPPPFEQYLPPGFGDVKIILGKCMAGFCSLRKGSHGMLLIPMEFDLEVKNAQLPKYRLECLVVKMPVLLRPF